MRAVLLPAVLLGSFMLGSVHAQTIDDAPVLFDRAGGHFQVGEYGQAITIYDEILEIAPENISTLKMKGIAQSNLGYHEKSLEQFFRILQYRPDDLHALAGMGVGLSYLGEYAEAQKYFETAIKLKPESVVLQNYVSYIDTVVEKYPYTPTEKPSQLLPKEAEAEIPSWVKGNARLWSEDRIGDAEFTYAMEFLIANKVIRVPGQGSTGTEGQGIPSWVKENAGLWADGAIDDGTFVAGLQFPTEGGIIRAEAPEVQEKTQKELDEEFFHFKQYVKKITRNVADEKRYIEFPNPSHDVIKKFLRDHVRWGFESEAKRAATGFPNPTFEIIDGMYVINYVMYVNDQPPGLPLDHVGTLQKSIAFWESQMLWADGQKARVKFTFTDSKADANVWVTWVVRNMGEGVLGHAHLGKGIVEVALGDYNCDGSFQLYDVDSVEYIMRHEMGHTVGLGHVDDPDHVMNPSYRPGYSYCLLS